METVFRLALIIVGMINAYPVIAAFSPRLLQNLYGIAIDEPNLLILMRQRAVLFGLLGGLLIAAAFDSTLYPYALIAGLTSMLTYILIALRTGDYNAKIRRVIYIDVAATIVLVLAYTLYWMNK